MVYGDPLSEQLQLNEETIWQGSPYNNFNPDALEALPEMRRLIFNGEYAAAQELGEQKFVTKVGNEMAYQTVGSLCIDFPKRKQAYNYERSLDIGRAVATTRYVSDNNTKFTHEVFASFTDNLIIMRISADKPGAIDCRISFTSPMSGAHSHVTPEGLLRLEGMSSASEYFPGGIYYVADVKAEAVSGTVVREDESLSISGSDELTLYISIATNIKNLRDISANPHERNAEWLKAADKPYEQLLGAHAAYYRSQFDRVKFDLGHTDLAFEPIEPRLQNFKRSHDPDLVATYFQYGRYLLISSSQPGTQPANLQGIWNASPTPL